jgi:fructosamine-3-kinase
MNDLEKILNEKIVSSGNISGGCIANAQKIETVSGKLYFLKSYSAGGSTILRNEANGLRELSKAAAIRVPEVIHQDNQALLLEYIKPGRKRKDFSQVFGEQFALLHKYISDKFGFYENNFIGSTPQINLPFKNNWAEFYWENRLLYQLKLAERNGYVNQNFRTAFSSLEKRVYELISGSEESPSLLHGDLWGGNYMVDEDGNPVLIDPAVYYGHREADLGMTKLFGGFDYTFYESYKNAYPLPYGWEEREDLYKLYHVMNHLNLFGSGYYSQTLSIIKSYS